MIYTINEKVQLLQELITMAYADGVLKASESRLIKATGKRLELSDDEVTDLIQAVTPKTIKPSKYHNKRIIQFHRLMLMMGIDRHHHDKELQFLHEVALQYGIRKNVVDILLKRMAQYEYGDIPVKELIEIHFNNIN